MVRKVNGFEYFMKVVLIFAVIVVIVFIGYYFFGGSKINIDVSITGGAIFDGGGGGEGVFEENSFVYYGGGNSDLKTGLDEEGGDEVDTNNEDRKGDEEKTDDALIDKEEGQSEDGTGSEDETDSEDEAEKKLEDKSEFIESYFDCLKKASQTNCDKMREGFCVAIVEQKRCSRVFEDRFISSKAAVNYGEYLDEFNDFLNSDVQDKLKCMDGCNPVYEEEVMKITDDCINNCLA